MLLVSLKTRNVLILLIFLMLKELFVPLQVIESLFVSDGDHVYSRSSKINVLI